MNAKIAFIDLFFFIENRARINLFINKFMKANPLTSELLKTTVDDVMMSSCIKNPSVFIRYC